MYMKKFIKWFFLVLGVIFFLILIAVGYIFITDTFGIRTLLTGNSSSVTDGGSQTDKNPLLSESQEQVLEKIGVDPAKLPTTITPEMAACFETKLGKERTDEIVNGDSPTAEDYLKAQSCIK